VDEVVSRNTEQAARHAVASELERLGLRVELTSFGRRVGLIARGNSGNNVAVLVRGKTGGTWQGSIDDPKVDPTPDHEFYWVFVDLNTSPPDFYVCPGSYIAADINRAHGRYLRHHGGERAQTKDSKHHAIRVHRVKGWKDAWAPLVFQANLSTEHAQSW